jgi:Lamin Tail Domain
VKRFIAAMCLLIGMGAILGWASTAAQAVSSDFQKVKITVFNFNARGTDTNANRNEEYVWLKNVSGEAVDIKGWKLTDSYGGPNALSFNSTTFKYNAGTHENDLKEVDGKIMLPAGASVVVYSGTGVDGSDNSTHAVYRAYHHYWNNGGDSVTVLDEGNDLVDRLSYNDYGINPTP